MPMIGGTTSWVGPLIGAILLGTLQQVATVTISSAVNLLIVGLLLIVDFVIIAPKGIVGLVQERRTQGTVVADPAVFALLYVSTGDLISSREALSPALEIIFWDLVYLPMRGGPPAAPLTVPGVCAIVSFVPGIRLAAARALNIAGLACGLLLKPQGPARLAPAARSGAP